ASTDLGLPGNATLDSLIPGFNTFDATVLAFDFVTTGNFLSFQYVFGSIEYNEFVGTSFNDVFGFFLNGTNVALLPGTNIAVSINNVNGGNPGNNPPPSNSQFFIDNENGALDTTMDGLTVVLCVNAVVTPGVVNHIELGIADAGDHILDSNVLIKARSFS